MSIPTIYVTILVIVAAVFAVGAIPVILARAARESHVPDGNPLTVGLALAVWLAVVTFLAITGAFQPTTDESVPPLGIAIVLALVAMGIAVIALPGLRSVLSDPMAQPGLVAVQVWRVAGLLFLVLLALGQLPPLFALPAGIGDVIVGLSAPVVARNLHRRGMALAWNLFGLADLGLAIFLGSSTTPGAARLFFTTPNSEVMTAFPMALIPAFLVPLSIGLHLVSLRFILSAGSSRTGTTGAIAV
jgi:hypothetical protein